ncbi:hypothetical protein, partial [Pseudarthrobacter sp. NKDBFgelt]|uniref:hypothetical protein n=1 Tax=Pseudarthrobacter sp. NKDBFgelt TaxID=3384443 RepID=UPI0038D432BE
MDPLHLRSAGTSLVISFDSGEAEVVHWGADLGADLPDLAILTAPVPHSAIDARVPAALLPQASSSWRGRAQLVELFPRVLVLSRHPPIVPN